MSFYEAFKRFRLKDPTADADMASGLTVFHDIATYGHIIKQFRRTQIARATLTAQKINTLVSSRLAQPKLTNVHYSYMLHLLDKGWLSPATTRAVLDIWASGHSPTIISPRWVVRNITPDVNTEHYVFGFTYALQSYKRARDGFKLNHLKTMVERAPAHTLTEICVAAHDETPAVVSMLLSRKDLEHRFLHKALLGYSKLTYPSVNAVALVTLDDLVKFKPYRRLKVIGMLFNFSANYYWRNKMAPDSIPFDPIPSRDEISQLLFPCVFKHNDKVTGVLKQYDAIIKRVNLNPDE